MSSFWIIYIQNICDKISFLSIFGCIFCLVGSVFYTGMDTFEKPIPKILFILGIIFGLIGIFTPSNIEKTYIEQQQQTIQELRQELTDTKIKLYQKQINKLESRGGNEVHTSTKLI